MVTLETYLNGKKLAIAGDSDLKLLMGHVSIFQRKEKEYEMTLHLGGVTTEDGHICWLEGSELKEGDTVTFNIENAEHVTAPVRVTDPSPTAEIGIIEWQKAKDIYETHRSKFENNSKVDLGDRIND